MVVNGFKKTEIGEIPIDWGVDKVKNHAMIATGERNTQDKIDDGKYPFFVRSQNVEKINSYSFDGEAVLTAGDGVGTGKVFHYINGKFDFHQRVYKISNFKPDLDGYFFYNIFSRGFYERIMSMTAKSSVDSVRMDMIADMFIPLPDIKEQKKISEVLADINALISTLEKLIVKKRAIKTAVMQQLLTGKTRLPSFSIAWKTYQIAEMLQFKHGKSKKSIEEKDGRYPILGTSGIIGRTNKYLFDKPSVLIGRKGTIDKPQYIDTPFWTIDTLFYSEIYEEFHPKFVYYLFQMINWSLYNEGSGVPSLRASSIEKIYIKLPEFSEQKAISNLLSDLDKEIYKLSCNLRKIKEIKIGMLQELLTGRTRLI